MVKMKYCVGIDIGNAKTEIAFYRKGVLNFVTQPSVISYLPKPPKANDRREEQLIEDLYDNLTVNFFSPKVKKNHTYHVGTKSLSYPSTIANMPIETGNKSSNDIPIITSMSMISAIALKDYYEKENVLPTELNVSLKMASAIPSSEYSLERAKYLEERFLQEHQVNLYVGEKTVLVKVHVTHCKVTEEGKTAMLAFLNSDEDILKHYNETYDKSAKPTDFKDALSLHADIGDGTSEFVFTTGVNPVAEGSDGMRTGVGHATTSAITMYKDELGGAIGDITRQHFMDLLQSNSEKARIAKEQMDLGIFGQAGKINQAIEQYFSSLTNSTANYFFVHGGGSIVFKDAMYEDLIEFAEKVYGEVVWIPEEYATHMNSRGTFHLAKILFCNNEK